MVTAFSGAIRAKSRAKGRREGESLFGANIGAIMASECAEIRGYILRTVYRLLGNVLDIKYELALGARGRRVSVACPLRVRRRGRAIEA
jgi:hypothetical protein